MIHVGNLVIRFVANYSYLPSPCLCLFYQIHEKMLIRCPTTTVTYHRLAQQASTQMSSRPSLQDQGDYELVSSKSHPQNRVIDVEDDTEMEDVSEPYKPVVVYRSPYCHERFITHFRKHAVFSSLFMVFAGLMCLSILALVSFIPDCTFKKDDGNDRYERALYADIRPRPESIPLVNTSTVNGTLLLEQFYTQYYHNITSKTYRIALLGDSLVGGLYITYDIKTMLQLYLPMFSFEILPFDVSGSRIADIRNRLDKVIAAKPDGTFLFFDSDCYDIDEYLLSRSKVSDIRDAYRTNLEYVLSTLLNSNPNGFVALGGPSIGEWRQSVCVMMMLICPDTILPLLSTFF